MVDVAPIVHIGENSPEQVAYKLLKTIASNEHKSLEGSMAGNASADKKWLLDTYAECLHTVKGYRSLPK